MSETKKIIDGWRVGLLACVLTALLAIGGGLCVAIPAWAATGPEVQDSFPVDGAKDVPTQGRFWVQFSNAVATVDENLDLVTLSEASGRKVSRKHWKVSLPDFELEFGYRQYIYLDMTELKPGTKYVIHIASGITAKNGMSSSTKTDITFTTAKTGVKAMDCVEPVPVEGGSGNGGGTGGGNGGGAGAGGGQAAGDADTSEELAGHQETGADGVTEIHLDASGRQSYGTGEQASRQKGELVLCRYSVGGVSSESNQAEISPEPSLSYLATLQFTGLVSLFNADDPEYKANCEKIRLQKADGTPVGSAEVEGYNDGQNSVVMYVCASEWLDPLTGYQIVCEPGLVDPQGNKTLKRYVIDFSTNDETSSGISVIPLCIGALVVLALAGGMTIQVVRRRRQRR